tara:strand:+ start:380 stop:1495 length:1116 start_codon:yes stop_codon:yes gene_type:complete
MAINATTYSGKQFAVYIAAEETTGTFNTTDASFHRIDVEGITVPPFSPDQEFEMRSGAGRIAAFDQVFSSSKRVMTEFTLTGRLTQEMWVILMENVTGDEFDGGTGSDSVLTLAYNYGGLGFKVGTDPASATDFAYLMSVYFAAPTAADSYSLKSCSCTNFNITADMDTAGGRFDYSATFQTQSAPAKGEQSGLIAASAGIGSNNLYLSLLDDKNIDIKNYSGSSDQDNITPLFKSFNMTVECPTQFLGATGASGEPEVWGKALPELTITYGGSIKYDDETDNMIEAFRDPDNLSYLTFYLADVAVAGTTETPTGVFFAASSVVKMGMWFGQSKLTSCEVSSDDVAMVNFEAKVLAPTSGNAAHFLGGDNV